MRLFLIQRVPPRLPEWKFACTYDNVRYHTNMQELAQQFPDVNDLLSLTPAQLGGTLLFLLKKRRFQMDMFLPNNLMNELWPQSYIPGQNTAYPREKRKEVETAQTEAWAWLERQGLIVPAGGTNGRVGGWLTLSREAKALDNLSDLAKTMGPQVLPKELNLIALSRIEELQKLPSTTFDFRKLIRLCEELNIAAREGCHFATAALTRATVDHVPPLFGKKNFSEVANNYAGTKSFREAIEHLDNAAKKVADGHLHTQIRKSETLPTAQQVNFASGLDVLLSEIVRISK
jgi:hypothetical protein